jgi:hypothetical protein
MRLELAAIAEQLHLNTLLSRKIHFMNESSSNDESSSEDDDNAEITLQCQEQRKEVRGGSEVALGLRNNLGVG